MNDLIEKNAAYVIFETDYGIINTYESREIRVLSLDGITTVPTSIETSSNPYTPGGIITGTHQESRIIAIQLTAPNIYRAQMIKLFHTGRSGKLTVNWGGNMRYIEYVVQDAEIIQETIAKRLIINITLLCPDVYFNDMNDFGENIAAKVPLIIFPNLWYIDDGLMTDYKQFESAVALENNGDVPIGIKFNIKAMKGDVLNPIIYLSESVYFRVFVQMRTGDELEISTVRRGKYVKLNGNNVLNRIDMTSTFFEIAPGVHKVYYGAKDGMENMEIYLYRRPQYLGV